MLKISGCIVVADAMTCQIETPKAILEAKTDYLLCAKSNQQTLKVDIEEYVHDNWLRTTCPQKLFFRPPPLKPPLLIGLIMRKNNREQLYVLCLCRFHNRIFGN